MPLVEGVIRVIDTNDVDHGDTVFFWQSETPRPHHGVDLKIGEHKIEVSVTRARKVVRIFVDGEEWKRA